MLSALLEVAVDSLRFDDNVTVLVLSVASVSCVVDEVRSSKTVCPECGCNKGRKATLYGDRDKGSVGKESSGKGNGRGKDEPTAEVSRLRKQLADVEKQLKTYP